MTNLTDLESKVLTAVIRSEFHSSCDEDIINEPIWADCVADSLDYLGVDAASRGGCISSCSKKGLVGWQADGDGDLIWITKEGYAAADAAGLLEG